MADTQNGALRSGDEVEGARKAADRGQQRRRLFALFGGVVFVVAVGYLLYWLLVGSHYVSTDNAYVGADVAQITPLVSGAVTAVNVADTEAVRRGQVLVTIDPADAQVSAAKARAMYDLAKRQVRQDLATSEQLDAGVAAREADVARADAQRASAESDLVKAKVDLERRQALATSGAVSGEELTSARNAYQTAVANLAAARAASAQAQANRSAAVAQLAAERALVQDTTPETNPQAQEAKAALDAALLDLARTVVRAPIDGIVARRQVQVGQRVSQGAVLMTIVPAEALYVDANFKEVQLKKVRLGQSVTLKSDKYGGGVVFHGKVAGIGGGTGSAFAVIPAQNATGNWIKVVQRLPVRISLDAAELRAHPLEVGLSMTATVNLSGAG
jgi:membrane fusion protein (multidrug efflux system)